MDILFGPYSSNLTMAAAEIAEGHKKILWNYGGTSDEVFGRGWHYIIEISSPAGDYFGTLPRWLADEYPELRRITVLDSASGTFGRQVCAGVIESAQESAHSVDLVPFDNPLKDRGLLVSRLLDLSPRLSFWQAIFKMSWQSCALARIGQQPYTPPQPWRRESVLSARSWERWPMGSYARASGSPT